MLERDPKIRISASKTLTLKFFMEGNLNLNKSDDGADTPLFFEPLNPNERDADSTTMFFFFFFFHDF